MRESIKTLFVTSLTTAFMLGAGVASAQETDAAPETEAPAVETETVETDDPVIVKAKDVKSKKDEDVKVIIRSDAEGEVMSEDAVEMIEAEDLTDIEEEAEEVKTEAEPDASPE